MIFEVFEDALAQLDEHGRQVVGRSWSEDVESGLEKLSNYYGNQNLRKSDRVLIDYCGLATQAAYLYMYGIGRAEFTYQLLKRFHKIIGRPLFGKPSLNITSIGGGPASEMVGIVRYLVDPESEEDVSEILYPFIPLTHV